MRLLGIDWGTSKVGVAYADGSLAEPLKVIRYKNEKDLFSDLEKIVTSYNIEKIVVGKSEGLSEMQAIHFGKKVEKKLSKPVEFVDETLTTYDAQTLALQAKVKKSKRKTMEDAYAASLVLQSYLDSRTI